MSGTVRMLPRVGSTTTRMRKSAVRNQGIPPKPSNPVVVKPRMKASCVKKLVAPCVSNGEESSPGSSSPTNCRLTALAE
eukprot:6193251-Prymnesium_polylepis.1